MRKAHISPVEEFVLSAIEQGVQFWMPGLAQRLLASFWQKRGKGFDASTYSSQRWLCGDPGGSRSISPLLNFPGTGPVSIEILPLGFQRHYENLGLQFRTEKLSVAEGSLCKDAFAALECSSGLLATTVLLVRCIHLLAASGPGIDISHSDPELPCSIFVSIPTNERFARLRLSESILHEAMHLQLTLLEQEVPLVHDTKATGYSPWKREERPIRGLLHGLFVFTVIRQWLDQARHSQALEAEESSHLAARWTQVLEEIALVESIRDSTSLTPIARQLVSWLVERWPLRPDAQLC